MATDHEHTHASPVSDGELTAYLAGDVRGQAGRRVEVWLAQDPARLAQANAVKRLAEEGSAPVTRARVDRLWQQVSNKVQPVFRQSRDIGASQPSTQVLHRLAPRRNNVWMRAGVAATALGTLAVAFFIVATRIPVPVDIGSEPARTFSTPSGQRATVTLADGSQVTLAPSSQMTVAYGTGRAEDVSVTLAGEAMFRVSHATSHVFTVTAHGVATRVLGTEFAVRAYDASRVRVVVREGRVSVQSPTLTRQHAVALSAMQSVLVTGNEIPRVRSITGSDPALAWTTGRLVLRDTPVGDALIELSRWYGREFRAVDQSLLSVRVDMEFPEQLNPQILQDFADILDARVRESGGEITFSARNSPHRR